MVADVIELDALIVGGGIAGLWTLDACVRRGHRVLLLEADALGSGQTIDAQGIIHGGLKYALDGINTRSASALADMPLVWRRCLAGESKPDLSAVHLRADSCTIWHTTSVRSRLGWLGARLALRIKPDLLAQDERPKVFRGCPGAVARLNEQVVEPGSVLEVLGDQHQRRLLRITPGSGLEFDHRDDGTILVRLINPDTGEPLDIAPRTIILCAGSGNAALRDELGLPPDVQQERPLHTPLVRGDLPTVNGHCVDGARTRITITTTTDYTDRKVWQLGGQIAEDGVTMDAMALSRHAANELAAVLPGIDLAGCEYSTRHSVRAERSHHGRRPADIGIAAEDSVLTCWPTKMALAPRLAEAVVEHLGEPVYDGPLESAAIATWPRPAVALPAWEIDQPWMTLEPASSPAP